MCVFPVNPSQNLCDLIHFLETQPCRHEQNHLWHSQIQTSWYPWVRVLSILIVQLLLENFNKLQKLRSKDFAVLSWGKNGIENCRTTLWIYCNLVAEIWVKEFLGQFSVVFIILINSVCPSVNHEFVVPEHIPFIWKTLDLKKDTRNNLTCFWRQWCNWLEVPSIK